MDYSLKEITQISIYLKDDSERINEVALFQPLMRKSVFNEESKPIVARKWNYTSNISFFRRVLLKIHTLIFKYLRSLIPSDRLTVEAKFKTVLAILLAQEEIRNFFLSHPTRQNDFYDALSEAANASGYKEFAPPPLAIAAENDPVKISRYLTQCQGKKESLIDNLIELNLQMAALNYQERSEILYRILNHVERPPINSVIEITSPEMTHSFFMTTQYAKYKITKIDEVSGEIAYTFSENHATSSIRTIKNSLPHAKGAMNQRNVFDAKTFDPVGSYCGELATSHHVLEQILLILDQKNGIIRRESFSQEANIKEKKILFTSLYSWHELGRILDQKVSIRQWDQKILNSQKKYKLHLLYFNIPFNALNKYPVPAEIKASIQDTNDETMILLAAEAFERLGIPCSDLHNMAKQVNALKDLGEKEFIEREKALLNLIDTYRKLKSRLIQKLDGISPINLILRALLLEKKRDGKALKGIDQLLYLDVLARYLGYIHNKNCQNATDRSASADAADKAQYVYQQMFQKPFLPGIDGDIEQNFFKVLYSMYLVWEEPEINTWLSTGFIGEKFYSNFIQKNPETTRYLVHWLKKNPEIYLGLSHHRT